MPGTTLSLLGTNYTLQAISTARRGVWIEEDGIMVSGHPEYFARRVADWLRVYAREEICQRAFPMAKQINRTIYRIGVRDTTSRWGSCTSRGHLSFSWRLVLAPADILTYVVAHEVSHLAEMNHSPAFWQVVEDVISRTTESPRLVEVTWRGIIPLRMKAGLWDYFSSR